jgi:Sulfotransferase family
VSETELVRGAASRGDNTPPDPSFLITGTSRSGTTLVQHLAWRLDGVRVPPETHFFGAYLFGLIERRTFPLDEAALRDELARFGKLRTSRGLEPDVDAIVRDLGGACASPWELFGGIVRGLAGPAAIYGEKTPEHVRCWEALTRRSPSLRLICVVREPRAVVASNLEVPFAPRSVPWLAQRWRTDQSIVRAARDGLGSDRCLVLRYEDVVVDPDAAVATMAGFLGTSVDTRPTPAGSMLHPEWEWWKERASQPITTDRIDAWRQALSPRDAELVVSICRRTMGTFGYPAEVGTWGALRRSAVVPPSEQYRRAHFRAKLARYRSRMRRVTL